MKTSSNFYCAGALALVFSLMHATIMRAQTSVPNARNGFGGIVIFTNDRIVAPSTPDPAGTIGWNIYRRAKNESTWKKLNSRPVQRSSERRDFETIFGENFLNDLVQLQAASSETAAWERVQATINREDAPIKPLFLDPRAVLPFGEAFVDSAAQLGIEYEYAVAPLAASGEGAKQSRGAAALQPPPELTILMGVNAKTLSPNAVELRWRCITKSGAVAGFEVLRSEVSPQGGSAVSSKPLPMRSLGLVLGNNAVNVFTDTTVQYGKLYKYCVLPFDAFLNKEDRRDTLTHLVAFVRDLPLPQRFLAQSTTSGIKLTWSLGKPPAPEYRGTIVLRADIEDMTRAREDSLYYPIDTLAYTQTAYIDRSVQAGTTHYYRLQTLGIDMSVSPMSTYYGAMFEMGRDKANIPPPVNVRGISTKEGIRITWSSLGIMPVEGYYVYRALSAKDSLELISGIVKDTVFLDSAKRLHPYSPYYYAVATVNTSFVWGTISERIAVRHDAAAKPEAPRAPSVHQEFGAVMVQWSNEAAMIPTLAGYHLYRIINGNQPEKLTSKPLPPTRTQFRDTQVPQMEATLQYVLTQIDAAGKESPFSPPATLENRLPPVRPPSGIAAIPTSKGVRLRWSLSTDKRITGYEIIRSVKGGKESSIGTVRAGVNEFTDRTIKQGEAYYYKILAQTAQGSSAPSAEVSVVP